MDASIQISNVNYNKHYLSFSLKGELRNCIQKEKIRLILILSHEHENRRIPVDITCNFIEGKNLKCEFEGIANIHIASVFFRNDLFKVCQMKPMLFVGYEELNDVILEIDQKNLDKRITFASNKIFIDGDLFSGKKKNNDGKFHKVYRLTLFLGCILCFPLFFIVGFIRLKGIKKALRYVSVTTGIISGWSYSVREWKTTFFTTCYYRKIKEPINTKRIVFLSERRFDPNGNLNRVKLELAKHNELEIILLQNEKTVANLSLPELKHIAEVISTAKIIILDDFYPQLHALDIRTESKVIQLWHACGAFKTFGFTRMDKPGWAPQQSKNHRCYDYTFVSGERIRSIYSEAFGIPIEHVLDLGVPRTDDFFSEEYKQAVYETLLQKYPMLYKKKVVLIAPTFRGDGNRDAYYPVDKISLDQLCEQLPEDYVFVTKMHPFVRDRFRYDEKYKDRIMDLSLNENINDLLFVTDILVTDYSSVIFEAALLNIPMIFYAYDMEEYMEKRDVYFEYEHFTPGPIVKSQSELCDELKHAAGDPDRMKIFKEVFVNSLDGKSTQRITDFIYHLI